jgi:cytochrome P450
MEYFRSSFLFLPKEALAIAQVPGSTSKVITGHKAVRDALRDTSTYSSDLQGDADVRDYRQLPLEVDPPRHHLYRSALGPYFVRPTVEKSIPEFRRHTEALINQYFSGASKDVISTLVLPLVMHNLGTLYRRPQDVQEWISWGPDVWTAESSTRDGKVLHAYLDRIYAEAIEGNHSDIWSELAILEIDGTVISADEFRGIAGVMLAGGRDTVVKLFTGMLWHFALHPEDLHLLRSNSALIHNAIQEFLRYLTPLPQMARTTTPETGASELPVDRYVGISFISGNFDESVFVDPLTINISREKNPHLSFGFGPHTCLGNHIAEMEAKVFLETLVNSGLQWEVIDSKIRFHQSPYMGVPDGFESLALATI